MHLVRKGMLDSGYDVLNIDYTGLISKEEDFEVNVTRILEVTKGVLLQNIEDYQGTKISMFARSLGSLIGAKLAQEDFMNLHKAVIVSPIGSAVDSIKQQKFRIYADPTDKYLGHGAYIKLLEFTNIELKEYKGAGHNFEYDNNMELTLETLKDVIMDIIVYMTQ